MGVRMTRFDLDRQRNEFEKQELLAQLKAKTEQSERGCWLWQMHRNRLGYGSLVFERKNWMAHRLAWVVMNGRIPEGLFVCHVCDEPSCINPAHLFLGTHTENQRDMVAKNRHSKGKKTHCYLGHPLSGDNLRVYSGHRKCAICERAALRIKKGWPKELAYSAPSTARGYRRPPDANQ